MSTPAGQAREALGGRLRDLRKDAGLTGMDLAALAGWHSSKISRVEYGKQNPSEDDIRVWCHHCGAEDQIPDLIATVRSIETMYVEWRRQLSSGTQKRQRERVAFEAETRLFRIFETFFVPGLVQTADYAAVVMGSVVEFHQLPDDVEQGVQARMERQQILYRGDHLFHMVICEVALTSGVVPRHVMLGQLDRLLAVISLPRIRLGVVPAKARQKFLPLHGFWILDQRMVQVETISASISLTQPREVELYERAFDRFASTAVYGKDARTLVTAALDNLQDEIPS